MVYSHVGVCSGGHTIYSCCSITFGVFYPHGMTHQDWAIFHKHDITRGFTPTHTMLFLGVPLSKHSCCWTGNMAEHVVKYVFRAHILERCEINASVHFLTKVRFCAKYSSVLKSEFTAKICFVLINELSKLSRLLVQNVVKMSSLPV